MPAAIKTGEKVWRECEECCGDGGYFDDVYERTLGPPTEIEAMMEQAQDALFKRMFEPSLFDFMKAEKP